MPFQNSKPGDDRDGDRAPCKIFGFPPKPAPYGRLVIRNRPYATRRLLSIFTGSGAMNEAAERYRLETTYSDPPTLYCALPHGRDPKRYTWDFAAGLDVAIQQCGDPEKNIAVVDLAECLINAGAASVTFALTTGRIVTLEAGHVR
jgi:hypothetical protein